MVDLVELVAQSGAQVLFGLSGTTLSSCKRVITRAPSPLLSNSAFFHNYPLELSVGILDT